jgi:hypothetical protein
MKATAWRNFSRFIRLRDALATTGTGTHARCITCGEVHPIVDMDAGHGIAGRTNGILFDETLVFAQCRKCNRQGGGESQAFKRILTDLHGPGWWELKQQAKRTATSLSYVELKAISDEYRDKYNKLARKEAQG